MRRSVRGRVTDWVRHVASSSNSLFINSLSCRVFLPAKLLGGKILKGDHAATGSAASQRFALFLSGRIDFHLPQPEGVFNCFEPPEDVRFSCPQAMASPKSGA